MEALVVRQILGMQSSIVLPDLGLMQNGKNGGLGEEHGILGPQQLRPPSGGDGSASLDACVSLGS